MHIIDLTPLAEGVYNDHASDSITAPPDGWAYIPEDFELPSTFPRLGSLTAEEITYTREVETCAGTETVTEPVEYTMLTVTAMTAGTLPEPEEAAVSTEETLLEIAADHEERLCMLELTTTTE